MSVVTRMRPVCGSSAFWGLRRKSILGDETSFGRESFPNFTHKTSADLSLEFRYWSFRSTVERWWVRLGTRISLLLFPTLLVCVVLQSGFRCTEVGAVVLRSLEAPCEGKVLSECPSCGRGGWDRHLTHLPEENSRDRRVSSCRTFVPCTS